MIGQMSQGRLARVLIVVVVPFACSDGEKRGSLRARAMPEPTGPIATPASINGLT